MRFTSHAVVGAALMTLTFLAGSGSAQTSTAQASVTPDLLALSREARTTRDHADLARRFRMQAEAFDTTAAEFEAKAKALTASAPPSVKKWPHLTMPDVTRAKQRAVEARRAARESRELSQHHAQQAV
ncbi:MAG: hypothetical protein AB7P67_15415, partial [Vicinamibacterales bacterium]